MTGTSQTAVPCLFSGGRTTKGAFFEERDLVVDAATHGTWRRT
jgi:2-methylaconitate cis-trans-isomerase PrpF